MTESDIATMVNWFHAADAAEDKRLGIRVPVESRAKSRAALADLLQARLAEADWFGAMVAMSKPLRLDYFSNVSQHLTDAEYWRLLSQAWIDTEAPSLHKRIWLARFTSKRPLRHELMTVEEREALAGLPETVVLYRGAPERFKRGMAWTTDIDRARWFAPRFSADGKVFTTTLPKEKIFAYLLGRKESEAVIDPRRIKIDVAAGQ